MALLMGVSSLAIVDVHISDISEPTCVRIMRSTTLESAQRCSCSQTAGFLRLLSRFRNRGPECKLSPQNAPTAMPPTTTHALSRRQLRVVFVMSGAGVNAASHGIIWSPTAHLPSGDRIAPNTSLPMRHTKIGGGVATIESRLWADHGSAHVGRDEAEAERRSFSARRPRASGLGPATAVAVLSTTRTDMGVRATRRRCGASA
jgi:hypothetical protein